MGSLTIEVILYMSHFRRDFVRIFTAEGAKRIHAEAAGKIHAATDAVHLHKKVWPCSYATGKLPASTAWTLLTIEVIADSAKRIHAEAAGKMHAATNAALFTQKGLIVLREMLRASAG
jgi:hypothetical protein